MKYENIGLRFFKNTIDTHNPFNKVIKFQKKENRHRTPSHTQQYLRVHFATHTLKISRKSLSIWSFFGTQLKDSSNNATKYSTSFNWEFNVQQSKVQFQTSQ